MREMAAAAVAVEEDEPGSGRRLLKRPTLDETNRIISECPSHGLTVPVIVAAIQQGTGCSRATAYRAIQDAFAAGIIRRNDEESS